MRILAPANLNVELCCPTSMADIDVGQRDARIALLIQEPVAAVGVAETLLLNGAIMDKHDYSRCKLHKNVNNVFRFFTRINSHCGLGRFGVVCERPSKVEKNDVDSVC